MRRSWIPLLVVAWGCGRPAGQPGAATAGSTKGPEPAATGTAMPDFPPATSGALRLVNTGPDDLGASVGARAGLCEDPAVLLVESTQQGIGALLVLALPGEKDRLGRYPVTYSVTGPAKLPEPPAAQLALQRITPRGAFGFQALEGTVELYGLGSKASGRFQVIVREVSSERIDRVAGAFADIPIERQPSSYCRRLADAAPDTVPAGRGR